MSFTTPILDTFNRADNSDLGTNWTFLNNSPMQIVSNMAAGGSDRRQEYYNPLGPLGRSEAYVTIAVVNDWSLVGVRVTSTGGCSGYYTQYGGGSLYLTKWDSNAESTLDSDTVTLANGDKIGIRAVGPSLTGWVYQSGSWTQRLSAEDAEFATGFLGLQQGLSTGRLDDFGGGVPPDWIDITVGIT